MQASEELRWDDVRLFLAAFRHKNLRQAAIRLGVDSSTMSRRLTAFERDLGMRLFERSREGLLPTGAAEQILDAAEAMEAAEARLMRDASCIESAPVGCVRLSAAPGLSEMFVAPMLVRLRREYPGIDIELDASVRALDLARHEADLALRSVPPRGAELVVTKLATARWVAVGSPSLVKSLGRLRSWSDAPWIGWDKDMAHFPAAAWISRNAGRAQVPLRTSQFASQIVAAQNGLGLILLPEPYLALLPLARARHVQSLNASAENWPIDDLWLVGHRALRDVPRVAAVWNFLATEFRKSLPEPKLRSKARTRLR